MADAGEEEREDRLSLIGRVARGERAEDARRGEPSVQAVGEGVNAEHVEGYISFLSLFHRGARELVGTRLTSWGIRGGEPGGQQRVRLVVVEEEDESRLEEGEEGDELVDEEEDIHLSACPGMSRVVSPESSLMFRRSRTQRSSEQIGMSCITTSLPMARLGPQRRMRGSRNGELRVAHAPNWDATTRVTPNESRSPTYAPRAAG